MVHVSSYEANSIYKLHQPETDDDLINYVRMIENLQNEYETKEK